MSNVEVHFSQESAESIPISEVPRDYLADEMRYRQEATEPGLPEWVVKTKLDTADLLGKLAAETAQSRSDLDHRIQQYLGNEKPTSR